MFVAEDKHGCKMVFAKLRYPTRIVRAGVRSMKNPFEYVVIHYSPKTPDTHQPETICIPAKMRDDGRIRIGCFQDMMTWHDSEPDFERYAEEVKADLLDDVVWP